jgi:hypothetical protein
VTATFSEAMDASTITGTSFQLVRLNADGTSTRVTATVSYAAATKKAILNPASNLSSRRTYKATVTTGAQDLADNIRSIRTPAWRATRARAGSSRSSSVGSP